MIGALEYEFMRNAIYAGIMASIACGLIGVYVITKRIVFISGGIAHASFGGIGLGYLAGFSPVLGAMFFAVAAALGMGGVTRKTKIPEDTAIGILWAMGMALGVVFIGLAPGYAPDLFGYLFGNILTVSSSDLLLMAGLNVFIIAVVLALYKEFQALSFDEEFGKVAGLPVNFLYLLLLGLIALTIVLLIRVVGIILVIALLTIPATLARQFTHDMKKMMFLAVVFGIALTFFGLWLSYEFDLASGATIILLSGSVMMVTFVVRYLLERRRRLAVTGVSEEEAGDFHFHKTGTP